MPQPDSKPSLLDYAAAKKPQAGCRVCEIPEVKEINAARMAGVSYDNIALWLVEACGYRSGLISKHRVSQHFQRNHHV